MIRVLIVCSYRLYSQSGIAPFIEEQVNALKCYGVEFEYFVLHKKGVVGYLTEFNGLLKAIKQYNPDFIHAHYGLCGLLANLQRSIPVVTTYHGSDINSKSTFWLSLISVKLSSWNVFVSNKLASKVGVKNKCSVVPCAVDLNLFKPQDKQMCRNYFGFNRDEKYVLFSKSFHVPVKNYPLAKESIDILKLKGERVSLIELKGYSREEVSMLMNACDCALLTSFSEGSPQFVKEALACNCPIVSTDVGDVKSVIYGLEQCSITTYEATNVANAIQRTFSYICRDLNERKCVEQMFSKEVVSKKILNIYYKIIEK